jgi:hypothetical protein
MTEEKIDINLEIEKMREKFNEFKKTYVAHIKNHDVEMKGWSFAVDKAGEGYIVNFAGKVEIMPKKK